MIEISFGARSTMGQGQVEYQKSHWRKEIRVVNFLQAMIFLRSVRIELSIFGFRRKSPWWFIARAVVDSAKEDGNKAGEEC